jgi:hypothetical protein
MKGYKKGKYKIRVKVDLIESDETEHNSPMKHNDGSCEMSIDEAGAKNKYDYFKTYALRTS